jgi:hypothetical protein
MLEIKKINKKETGYQYLASSIVTFRSGLAVYVNP